MDSELVLDLAIGLRERVLPALGSHSGRAHAGDEDSSLEAGGDVTFAIDADAEALLEAFVAEHAPATAFYSEYRITIAEVVADHSWTKE